MLAVAKLCNWTTLKDGLNLPGRLLAMQRFPVAVGVSRRDWEAVGPLSGVHTGLIVPASAAVLPWPLQDALDEFAYDDPWSGAHVRLRGVGVLVPLEDAVSVPAALRTADSLLVQAENGMGYANDVSRWCRDIEFR